MVGTVVGIVKLHNFIVMQISIYMFIDIMCIEDISQL
jgi:hypothetical protein